MIDVPERAGLERRDLRRPGSSRRSHGKPGPDRRADFRIAGWALACITAHLIMRFGWQAPPRIGNIPLFAALAGGLPLLFHLGRKLLSLDFGADLLAGMSMVTAFLTREYLVGAIIVLMFSSGTALENWAAGRASSALAALAKRLPQIAHRKHNSGFQDIRLSEVVVGDKLIVLPHETVPADGIVTEGDTVMDESYLTGEPFVVRKAPGSDVISGAINGDAAVGMVVSTLPEDSRFAKIVRVLEDSEQKRPRVRRLGDRLGAWYTPLAVLIAGAAWAVTGESHRFLSVLAVATPCPLLIGIPVAVLGAISLSARRGILVRNPAIFENLDSCDTFIFDKTGTLTYGKPSLTHVICAPGFSEESVLQAAAALERYSKHPLAQAVVDAAEARSLGLLPVALIGEKPGAGVRGMVSSCVVEITGRTKLSAAQQQNLPPAGAGLECVVLMDGLYAATLQFHDAPRPDSRGFLRHLRPRHRVKRLLLLSGDRESEVRYLATQVGIEEFYFSKSPEEKVAIVEAETRQHRTVYIGDGVNDAPAMTVATIGVALGPRSDVTAEAADAVIMQGSMIKIDELLHIGRRMRRIALQSAIGGMALSVVGMALAAGGLLPPVAAALFQELIDLLAVLNAVRVPFPLDTLSDV